MTLPEKVQAVEQLFAELDEAMMRFREGINLSCPVWCVKCCLKPDIEATVLEFLPLAMHLYRQGEAEALYERLKTEKLPACSILSLTQGDKGYCGQYAYRGLICRLFGYAARPNKYGVLNLVTCPVLRSQPGYPAAAKDVESGNAEVPLIRSWYMRLQAIDPVTGIERMPVNEAIYRALQIVLHDMSYRMSA